MFNNWLKSNKISSFDLTSPLYPAASDRDFWDKVYDPEFVEKAEEYLGYEWPMIRATDYIDYVKTGNRRTQENPHFIRRTVLCTLVIGEIVEHKGRFIPDIVDGIFAICEESFWGVSAHSICHNIPDGVKSRSHVDLFAAETGALIAMTCYMLKDEFEEFCPEIIARAETELRHRILEPYITRTDFFWMGYGYPVNNWTSWIISNILTVYLLTEKDKEKLSRAVEKMMLEMNRLYDAYPDDGGCDEGACYWAVSGGSLYEFCDQLYVASGGAIDFFRDEKLRRIGRFIYRAYIGNGYFANFADGAPKITHSMTGLLWMIGLRTGDEQFFGLAKELQKNDPEKNNITPVAERDAKIKRRLYDMIYREDIAAAPDSVPAEADILEVLQVAVTRAGDWCVAAKGGHNGENHNHNDVGSFIAYFENEPVLVDPSCGTYTKFSGGSTRYDIWTNHSGWHNLPQINGVRQKEGREYGADSFKLAGKTVSVSFAGAYPVEAAICGLCRSITASEDFVTVYDTVTLAEEGSVAENFITPLSVRIDGNKAVIGEKFILECDTHAEITADSVSFDGDERLSLYWKSEEMKRVNFTFAASDTLRVRFTLGRI